MRVFFIIVGLLVSFQLCAVEVKQIKNSVTEGILCAIRDSNTDRSTFRASLEKMGELIALEISNDMPKKYCEVETAMHAKAVQLIRDDREKVALVTIMRGGLPLFEGVYKVFSEAEAGFLGIKRDEKTVEASMYYAALPDLKDKIVILVDTMIATGGSMLEAINIVEKQQPKKIIVVGVLLTDMAIDRIKAHNKDIEFYCSCIDHKMDKNGFIIPGLGDAGDKCYGIKHD
jgi:uracil phosphoribosyltransferase